MHFEIIVSVSICILLINSRTKIMMPIKLFALNFILYSILLKVQLGKLPQQACLYTCICALNYFVALYPKAHLSLVLIIEIVNKTLNF